MTTALVELHKVGGNLSVRLTPAGRAELADIQERNGNESDGVMCDLLEYQLCNGWELVRPEEIGALTGCTLILSDSVERDDKGTVTAVDRVYWHSDYAVTDPVEVLAKGQSLLLVGVSFDE